MNDRGALLRGGHRIRQPGDKPVHFGNVAGARGFILPRPARNLPREIIARLAIVGQAERREIDQMQAGKRFIGGIVDGGAFSRSEEHTSELQSLMRSSYAVFWLKKHKPTRGYKNRQQS